MGIFRLLAVPIFNIFPLCFRYHCFGMSFGLVFCCFFLIYTQTADQLGLTNNTKYMAKKYYDIFLSRFPQCSILLILTCLRTATKFNQTGEIMSRFTLEQCLAQCQGQYSKKDFIECQSTLLSILNSNPQLPTPYNFLPQTDFPHLTTPTSILSSIIDFALSVAQLRTASAEALFFGSLLYSCRHKNQPPPTYTIIQAVTLRWEESQFVCQCLEENMRGFGFE